MRYYQHGDLLLKTTDKLPSSLMELETLTLLTGSNGHDHKFKEGSAARIFKAGDDLYVDVAEESMLVHDEHKPIAVAPGFYIMDRVREFDPTTEEVRRVVD